MGQWQDLQTAHTKHNAYKDLLPEWHLAAPKLRQRHYQHAKVGYDGYYGYCPGDGRWGEACAGPVTLPTDPEEADRLALE